MIIIMIIISFYISRFSYFFLHPPKPVLNLSGFCHTRTKLSSLVLYVPASW